MAEEKKNEVETVPDNAVTVLDENDVVHLKKPLTNGQDFIAFAWDRVTGYTLIRCLKNAKKEDPGMTLPALSLPYQAAVAAYASGVKYDDILSLSAPDFMAVTLKAQNFLLQSAT